MHISNTLQCKPQQRFCRLGLNDRLNGSNLNDNKYLKSSYISFKGYVDSSVKEQLDLSLRAFCEDLLDNANTCNRIVDTRNVVQLKNMIHSSLKTLEDCMKNCHSKTSISLDAVSGGLKGIMFKNASITKECLDIRKDIRRLNFIEGAENVNIISPVPNNYTPATYIMDFAEFVQTFTEKYTPLSVDKFLLARGREEVLDSAKTISRSGRLLTKVKVNNHIKIAKQLGVDDLYETRLRHDVNNVQISKNREKLMFENQSELAKKNRAAIEKLLND